MHQQWVILMVFWLTMAFGQFTEFSTDYKDDNVIDYSFRYYVDDADVTMDHWEERRDGKVIGRYALLEPSGYVRSVYYIVDSGSGFRSSVQTRMLGVLTQHQKIVFNKKRLSQPIHPYQHLLPIAAI